MAEKKKIAQAAYDLLKEYKIDTSKGVDIIELAHKMGFVVGNAGLDDGDDGFIMVNEDVDEILGIKTSKLIGVNANRELMDKRFIIAHEIGHYIMHCKKNKIYAHRESMHGRSEAENDVDYFAACLLMPEDEFGNEFRKEKSENNTLFQITKKLQEKFAVPFESASRRIDELELLKDN